ncbi:hypothetical protein KDW_41470 [Dictyobacter vulcani]|uniref:Uncharacterized protein n=1 Tax=Dictyobacter vulcani TaxID=2607529 RepID=A0A5J4KQ54_9CHLR|nr:hypothetical protein KDW_41470 [Dictyobacter vulcani]
MLTHERFYVSMNETREVVQELTEPSEESDRSLYSWSPNGKQIAVRVYGSREDVTSGLALSVGDPERRAGHEYYTLIQIWESESFWESHTPRLYRTLVLISGSGIGPGISCTSWSPDGKILAIGQRTLVHLWKPQTERVVATYTSGIKQGPEDLRDFFNDIASIDRIYWSPDGLFLACVGHIGIEIWEISTGEKFVTYYEHISAIVDVKWLMEKETIVSVDQDDIHVWHFRDGRVLQKVRIPYPRGEEDSVLFTAALSPDLSALACAGYKGRGPLTEEVEGILWIWRHNREFM